jgi:hypothetical protein
MTETYAHWRKRILEVCKIRGMRKIDFHHPATGRGLDNPPPSKKVK